MTTGFRDLADWTHTSPKQLVAIHLAKAKNTERGYRQDLAVFARWMGKDDMCEAVRELLDHGRAGAKRLLVAWVNDMARADLSAGTIRRRAASLKSLISQACDPDIEIIGWDIGKLPNLPPQARVRDVTGPSVRDVDRMRASCDERADAKGRRDMAVMALLYGAALRASEALSVRVQDVDLRGHSIRIVGKRSQGRVTLHVGPEVSEIIGRWIEVRGGASGPLLMTCPLGKTAKPRPLTYEGLRWIVRALGQTCGVRCWPHGLRHAAVSHLALFTHDSPAWGCALSRHRDVRAWAGYQDRKVSHASASSVLWRRQYVGSEPPATDN